MTPPPPADALLTAGSIWKYRDTGADLGTTWRGYHFDDSAWASGPAPLGYGDPMATTIGYGPDATNKYVTTYFQIDPAVSRVSAGGGGVTPVRNGPVIS